MLLAVVLNYAFMWCDVHFFMFSTMFLYLSSKSCSCHVGDGMTVKKIRVCTAFGLAIVTKFPALLYINLSNLDTPKFGKTIKFKTVLFYYSQ